MNSARSTSSRGHAPIQGRTVSARGRTLDVSSTGEAGVDWANVGSPTTSLNLSGTTVGVAAALGAQAKTDVTAAVPAQIPPAIVL